MKVADIEVPDGNLPTYLKTCKQIVEFGSCTNWSILCINCPFHETGLCNDVWEHAKEFIELHKEKV